MRHQDETFADTDVVLDDDKYSTCTFSRCRLIYRGGGVPTLVGCQFEDCTWHFEQAADRTLGFLRMLYHGLGPGGAALIEGTIEIIRQPFGTA